MTFAIRFLPGAVGEHLRPWEGFVFMRDTDKFYGTMAWKRTRDAYVKSVGGLCERCLKSGLIRAGEFVHHKTHLNGENVMDPEVTLSFDNLELLCRDCHAAEHAKRRYVVDADGFVHGR